MALYTSLGGQDLAISDEQLRELIRQTIDASGVKPRKMLLLPPDHTRLNSYAGPITRMIWEEYSPSCEIHIMPALGTHKPMSDAELEMMFGTTIPKSAFRVHDWRNGVRTMGTIPSEMLRELSKGKLDYEIQVQVDNILFQGYDLILSIGQIVPHEVVGMANYTKNIMVGVGGHDIINKSHFLGAVSGLENLMGRADSPVRRLFNYGVDTFLADLPIVYMQTVLSRDDATGKMALRGFFSGTGADAYLAACKLAVQTNLILLDKPLKKVIVFLDPKEFKTTWLGNKAIYRTRMAIADDGDLIILAPGLEGFGEDPQMDAIIRKYGYKGTPKTLQAVRDNQDMKDNLGGAAHLIHGSSEGRFRITYCPGPKVSQQEIESVGFQYGNLEEIRAKYHTDSLKDGVNVVDGEEVFYISNPALGLWALKRNFVE